MADNGNFFENITSAIGNLFGGAQEEVTNKVEEAVQNVQDANPLDALNGDNPKEKK